MDSTHSSSVSVRSSRVLAKCGPQQARLCLLLERVPPALARCTFFSPAFVLRLCSVSLPSDANRNLVRQALSWLTPEEALLGLLLLQD